MGRPRTAQMEGDNAEAFDSLELTPTDMIWDDSALMDAYDRAVNQYKSVHPSGSKNSSKQSGPSKSAEASTGTKGNTRKPDASKQNKSRSGASVQQDAAPSQQWDTPEPSAWSVVSTLPPAGPNLLVEGAGAFEQPTDTQDEDTVVFYQDGELIGSMQPGEALPGHIFGQGLDTQQADTVPTGSESAGFQQQQHQQHQQ